MHLDLFQLCVDSQIIGKRVNILSNHLSPIDNKQNVDD